MNEIWQTIVKKFPKEPLSHSERMEKLAMPEAKEIKDAIAFFPEILDHILGENIIANREIKEKIQETFPKRKKDISLLEKKAIIDTREYRKFLENFIKEEKAKDIQVQMQKKYEKEKATKNKKKETKETLDCVFWKEDENANIFELLEAQKEKIYESEELISTLNKKLKMRITH